MKLTNEDLYFTDYAATCRLLQINPITVTGRLGVSVREIEKTWKTALRSELANAPMPNVPSHQWDLARELRLVVKRALTARRLLDNEISRLEAERDALNAVLD